MLILAAVATSAAAQRMSDSLPDCAVDCLEQGVEAATDCALDDGDCICEVDNYRDTYDASTACVLQACGAARALGKSNSPRLPSFLLTHLHYFLLLHSFDMGREVPVVHPACITCRMVYSTRSGAVS